MSTANDRPDGLGSGMAPPEGDAPSDPARLQALQEQVRELEGRLSRLTTEPAYQSLQATLDALPDLLFEVDAEGTIQDFRAPRPDLLFVRPEMFLGRPIRTVLPPEACAVIERSLEMATRNHLHRGEIYALDLPSGRSWFELSMAAKNVAPGAPPRFIALVRDITARKQAEERQQQADHWLRESQLASGVGNYVLEVTTGQWTGSAGLDSLFGIGPTYPHDLDGWARLVHPDHREALVAYLRDEVLGKRQPFDREYPIQRVDDGRTRWLAGRGALLLDDQGVPVRLAGIIMDVTDRRRLDEERLRLDARIQQTQKLESLGVLAGGIAHDFNNLLMVILGNVDLALQDLSEVSPARPMMLEIEQVAHRAADLCKQMLAYSGKGRFVVRPIDLGEVVEEMRTMMQSAISRKATLRLDLARPLPRIEADVSQIRQVVMNLVLNASEALGGASGMVSITTGQLACDRAYLDGTRQFQDLPEGQYVFLEVSDTGCGMEATTLERIFEPFFSTKFTGRGLGLAAVLGIVRGHRGAMKVYTELGKGSTFKLLLPAAGDDLQTVTLPTVAQWTGSGTILVVDDDETVRSLCQRMLERMGFTVLHAADGRQALEVFREHAGTIRCVLLDLTMPVMDGEETFRELRRLDPAVRVLLSSGYNEQEVISRFVGKGLAGFVQKPYQFSALQTALRTALQTPAG